MAIAITIINLPSLQERDGRRPWGLFWSALFLILNRRFFWLFYWQSCIWSFWKPWKCCRWLIFWMNKINDEFFIIYCWIWMLIQKKKWWYVLKLISNKKCGRVFVDFWCFSSKLWKPFWRIANLNWWFVVLNLCNQCEFHE